MDPLYFLSRLHRWDLVWHLSRRVVAAKSGLREDQFVDIDPWGEQTEARSEHGGNSRHGQGGQSSVVTTTASIKERGLKMSALLDAQDESELLPPSNEEVNNWTQAYVTIMGALPDPAEEPTASQLAALAKRTLVSRLCALYGFQCLDPLCKTHDKEPEVQDSFSTGGRVIPQQGELPGPVNFQMWLGCWRVFKSAALMLNISTAGGPDELREVR